MCLRALISVVVYCNTLTISIYVHSDIYRYIFNRHSSSAYSLGIRCEVLSKDTRFLGLGDV